jgi:hypothetical protein
MDHHIVSNRLEEKPPHCFKEKPKSIFRPSKLPLTLDHVVKADLGGHEAFVAYRRIVRPF